MVHEIIFVRSVERWTGKRDKVASEENGHITVLNEEKGLPLLHVFLKAGKEH